jgi:hypothetical protein
LTSAAAVLAVGFLASHLEGGVLRRTFGIIDLSATAHRWRAFSSGKLVRKHALLADVFVVVGTVHVCVFSNALFARFPAHKRASHGACHNAGCHDEDCSRKHDPATPFHVWNEEKNVNKEGQKSNQQCWNGENKKGQKEARRVARRMEMRGNGQREAYQDKERCDGMHN